MTKLGIFPLLEWYWLMFHTRRIDFFNLCSRCRPLNKAEKEARSYSVVDTPTARIITNIFDYSVGAILRPRYIGT